MTARVCVALLTCLLVVRASLGQQDCTVQGQLVGGAQTGYCCCRALQGVWVNTLGSEMELECDSSGVMTGLYGSNVGNANGSYTLVGRFTDGTAGYTCIVGWSVAYHNDFKGNSKSLSSWSGMYFFEEDKIYAQWLLTRDHDRAHLWESCMVNQDEFTPKPSN